MTKQHNNKRREIKKTKPTNKPINKTTKQVKSKKGVKTKKFK